MPIAESQLQTWAHQGAVASAKETAASIEHALSSYSWPDGLSYEVYLQGSYKNSTNIRGDSDVDVVVQLNSCFYSNLSEEQKRRLRLRRGRYSFSDFHSIVLDALLSYYRSSSVIVGSKAFKVRATRLPADVIACVQYRHYSNPDQSQSHAQGITFWTQDTARRIVNYPKIHYRNGVHKNQTSAGYFKRTVRMFKNVRSLLVELNIISENLAPSYFVECLLYNVPDENFSRGFQDTFCGVLNWLCDAHLPALWSQSCQTRLFGEGPVQWTVREARQFIDWLVWLWDNS